MLLTRSRSDTAVPTQRDHAVPATDGPRAANEDRVASSRSAPVRSDDDRLDCEELIDSVKGSLWGLLEEPADADPATPAHQAAERVRSAAIQGTRALERLQSTLAHEFALREQLEHEIAGARAELEAARSELAGTRLQVQRSRYLATHDQLTGLANRGCFQDHLVRSLAPADPGTTRAIGRAAGPHGLAVLFLDLDGFKPVNDTHGHATGDALLRIVATRLARAVRAQDIVGRLGGDEFACLLDGVATREQAQHLAAKLRRAIQAPCRVGDTAITVGVSVGIAIYPADGHSADDLLLKADLAMYRAKREGSGVASYDDR